MRRDQLEGHGTAGCGQHRPVRPPGAHQGAPGAQERQGHPGFRARSPGPGRDPEAERRQRHLRLHPRRDAPHARLPRPQEVPPFLRPLRHRLAEPGQGVRPVPRGHRHDHQLHPAAPGNLCPQPLHPGPGGLAGHHPHPGPQLQAGDRQGPGPAGLYRRQRMASRS